ILFARFADVTMADTLTLLVGPSTYVVAEGAGITSGFLTAAYHILNWPRIVARRLRAVRNERAEVERALKWVQGLKGQVIPSSGPRQDLSSLQRIPRCSAASRGDPLQRKGGQRPPGVC